MFSIAAWVVIGLVLFWAVMFRAAAEAERDERARQERELGDDFDRL